MPTGNEGLPHNAHCPFNKGKNKRIIIILLDKVVILLIMNLVNYKLSPPHHYNFKKKMLNHTIYTLGEKTEVVPDQFKPNCINPEIFFNLKTKLKLESVLLLDRTYPKFKSDVCIIDHINRSGYNFLIGKTPFKDNFDQKKVDEILDKIANSVYESLTKEEKKYLFKIGKK